MTLLFSGSHRFAVIIFMRKSDEALRLWAERQLLSVRVSKSLSGTRECCTNKRNCTEDKRLLLLIDNKELICDFMITVRSIPARGQPVRVSVPTSNE